MDLKKLAEALERHGLTVPAQKRRGLKTYEGEDGELLRADDAGLIRAAARAYRDALANGERVEWCVPHRNEAWEDFDGEEPPFKFRGYRCPSGAWIEGANAWDCRIVSRLLIPPTEEDD